MGYQIRYDAGKAVKTGLKERKRSAVGMVAAGLVALCLFVRLFWPAGMDKLRRMVFPGDPEVTGRAAEQMVSQIHEGVPVGDAVQAFCREILNEAGYPD